MTDSVSPFDKQIANRNYMSPVGFKLILTKTPKVDFLCQSANIPQISMGTAIQPSYLKDIPVPGDKVLYDDLNVRFLVDEKMENYLAIYKWITGLGFPESIGQFEQLRKDDLRTDASVNDDADPRYFEFSDATLQILNSNMDDKEAAKLIIKRSKKNPILYSPAEILYVKRIKKLQKVND